MNWTKLAVVALGVGALSTVIPGRARADEWNKRTTVKFNDAVEIPGQVLLPGTYTFKLMDSQTDRNIVQIFNKHEDHLYATILTIPDYRLRPSKKTVITFEERTANSPEAIRAWFFPGDQYGQEFVYPEPRAMQLAKVNNRTVASMPEAMTANTTKPAKSAQEPHVMALKQAPITRMGPKGERTQMAMVAPPAAPAPEPAPAPAPATPRQLPKTASDLPLLALIGLLSLGAGLGLRLAAGKRA